MDRLQPDDLAPGGDDRSGRDRRETARYIEELCVELSGMARRSDLSILSYLLDLARAEAGLSARYGSQVLIPPIKKRG